MFEYQFMTDEGSKDSFRMSINPMSVFIIIQTLAWPAGLSAFFGNFYLHLNGEPGG